MKIAHISQLLSGISKVVIFFTCFHEIRAIEFEELSIATKSGCQHIYWKGDGWCDDGNNNPGNYPHYFYCYLLIMARWHFIQYIWH